MRRVGISEGSLGAQNALPPEHRFLRYARDHPRLSYFIRGVDAVAERPLISALSFGMLPTLFAVAKSTSLGILVFPFDIVLAGNDPNTNESVFFNADFNAIASILFNS